MADSLTEFVAIMNVALTGSDVSFTLPTETRRVRMAVQSASTGTSYATVSQTAGSSGFTLRDSGSTTGIKSPPLEIWTRASAETQTYHVVGTNGATLEIFIERGLGFAE